MIGFVIFSLQICISSASQWFSKSWSVRCSTVQATGASWADQPQYEQCLGNPDDINRHISEKGSGQISYSERSQQGNVCMHVVWFHIQNNWQLTINYRS